MAYTCNTCVLQLGRTAAGMGSGGSKASEKRCGTALRCLAGEAMMSASPIAFWKLYRLTGVTSPYVLDATAAQARGSHRARIKLELCEQACRGWRRIAFTTSSVRQFCRNGGFHAADGRSGLVTPMHRSGSRSLGAAGVYQKRDHRRCSYLHRDRPASAGQMVNHVRTRRLETWL